MLWEIDEVLTLSDFMLWEIDEVFLVIAITFVDN